MAHTVVGELSQLRRVGASAQRPGRRRSGNAANPEALQPEENGRWLGRRADGDAEPTGEPSQGIGTVEMEPGFDPKVKAELEKRGYKVVPGTGAFGGYQAIQFDPTNHVYWGASEMRRDGEVIGY